ncbi:unnamed protein product [Polarella glacialis]|uniref:Mitochondrial carrier protein n=1 Tax=Polarella glacialis TaxID=89957 RepID=A0A813EET0_POLGL|nr:unnamed protein product [Polarella glacialis]CAE8718115.1 unnamed protein product [Polarella glacialis]
MLEDAAQCRIEVLLPPMPYRELAASVAAGGLAAGACCAQVEHVITRAHAQGDTIPGIVRYLYCQPGGLQMLLMPPGILAIICREAPFVFALFHVRPVVTDFVYGRFVTGPETDPTFVSSASVSSDLLRTKTWKPHLELIAGFATAALTCPVSHVPSVVAAYQQGHGVGMLRACTEIYRRGGLRSFWCGLIARTLSLGGTMTVVPNIIRLLGGDSEPAMSG